MDSMVLSNELPVLAIGVYCASANVAGTNNLELITLGTDDVGTEVYSAGAFDCPSRATVIFIGGIYLCWY